MGRAVREEAEGYAEVVARTQLQDAAAIDLGRADVGVAQEVSVDLVYVREAALQVQLPVSGSQPLRRASQSGTEL
jgi:hypothetical protein